MFPCLAQVLAVTHSSAFQGVCDVLVQVWLPR